MKAAPAKQSLIRIAVVESDPLRFVGFRALFDSEPDFQLISASLPDIPTRRNIDLVLLGNYHGQNLFDVMVCLKMPCPRLPIVVTGSGMNEQTILKAIASGAKGYVDAAASLRISCKRYGSSAKARSGLPGEYFPCSLNA